MGWLDNLSGYAQGFWNAVTNLKSSLINAVTHGYQDVTDDVETDTEVASFRTVVVTGEPLRKTKFLFVPEMCDFYTDEELNDVYHSADEYRHAIDKYGFIYKTQKFDNADTPQKLLDYAKDWIKNNYHGGITSFTVNALDLHMVDRPDLNKFTVGRRVPIVYIDPATRQQTGQTLTCISVEYDLNNPEKNQYKIGIPDIALNKVYGETDKKGGGGGGGGKTSDETDNETDTAVDVLQDAGDTLNRILDENMWAHIITGLKTDEEGGWSLADLSTPGEKDPTNNNVFAMVADAFKSTYGELVEAKINDLKCAFADFTNGIQTKKMSAETSSTGRTNAESIDAVNFVQCLNGKIKSKLGEIAETLTAKVGEFSESLKVGGKDVATMDDIPSVPTSKVTVTIGSSRYELYGKKLD